MVARTVDNGRVKLSDALVELARNHKHLSIATGFWDLKGLALIFEEIRNFESVRLLIGQEPIPSAYLDLGKANQLDLDFPDLQLKASMAVTPQSESIRAMVSEMAAMIAEGRFSVKVYRGDFLHAKTYIFGDSNSENAVGIIGSSNFTGAGLTTNIELNAVETDARVVRWKPTSDEDEHGHLSWFNEIWASEASEDWDGRFSEVVRFSPAGDFLYSPREMYLRTLYELYSEELVPDFSVAGEIEEVLFDFQIRNAKLLLRTLEKYGLAMLADSVGLGKTITAGAVIRHYVEELEARRVYVISPANLTTQWREDLARVNGLVSGFEILSMQDLTRIREERRLDRYASVDLFVIDEAHNLRSGSGVRHDELLDWFSDNFDSHVLLLTATPINNSLNDFVAQVQLAAKGKLESFPVVFPTSKKTEVIDFFEAVQRLANEVKRFEREGKRPDFDKIHRIMRQGLRHFLVRTTRRGIELEFGGIQQPGGPAKTFPKSTVLPTVFQFSPEIMPRLEQVLASHSEALEGFDPRRLDVANLVGQTQREKHPLDSIEQEPNDPASEVMNPFERIFSILLLLGFAPYRADLYKKELFGKRSEEIAKLGLKADESFRIISQLSVHNMLRVNLLKRFESSQFALRRSLENYLRRLNDFERLVDEGFIVSIKNIELLKTEFGDDLDFFEEATESFESLSTPADPKTFNIPALKKDLDRDRRLLAVLIEICEILDEHDTKVVRLAELVSEAMSNQVNGGKVLVFSYFTDTVAYLEEKLATLLPNLFDSGSIAFTVGKTKGEIEKLARRFSPVSKGGLDEVSEFGELDVLVASDVLSEGQNLQDCGVLVNFDLHWNPVRMIQRNGRINRLGSVHEEVLIHNIHPDINLDNYLSLVARLEHKIDRIRYTVGTDQSVLGEEANPIEYVDEIEAALTTPKLVADLYDPSGAQESLAKLEDDGDLLSEDEFVLDLRQFEASATPEERSRVKGIPAGKWGLLTEEAGRRLSGASALGLVRISPRAEGSETGPANHIFVSTTGSVGPVESVDALRALRSGSFDDQPKRDTISVDRNTVNLRSIQVAKAQAGRTRTLFRVTPSIARVLDKLKAQAPELDIAVSLQRISAKQELKRAKNLLSRASQEYREFGNITEETVSSLSGLCAALDAKAESLPSLDETQFEGVLFFGR